MNTTLPNWERSHYQAGDGRALIYYAIYGEFSAKAEISRSKYRTLGLPAGFTMTRLDRKQGERLPFTDEEFGKGIADKTLLTPIRSAPQCLVLRGEIPDPIDLNYLRDAIGIVTFALDHGGFAVCDPQRLALYDQERWRQEIFEPEATNLPKHVVILYSEEARERWYHTRGLRKFARPDISVRHVPEEYWRAVIDLCNRFILLQALGGRIPEGQEIRMASLPAGLICHHAGSLDNPDFNNVHVEIQWGDGK